MACLASLCLGGLLAACSTGAPTASSSTALTPNPTATTAAPATAAPASQTPTASSAPRLALTPGQAGTYQLLARDPQVRLTLGAGWSLYFDESGGTYMSLGPAEFLVLHPGQVIDPETSSPVPVPEDLMGWFAEHPGLHAGKPKAIEISGIKARYVDVNPTTSVDVFYDPLGNFHVGPGPAARFYAVPLDGPDLFIAVLRSPTSTLEAALAVGIPVVESLEILD